VTKNSLDEHVDGSGEIVATATKIAPGLDLLVWSPFASDSRLATANQNCHHS